MTNKDMIHETSRVCRFKAIILGILLLSSFAALSLSHVPISFAQQNITDIELQQNSNANLSETLARQLGKVFESSSASSLENVTLPTIGVPSSTNGSQPSNVFPEVDANAPPIVNQGEIVSLNGTGTYDRDSNQLQYAWSQDSGIPVSINDDDQPVAHFTAPTVSQNSILVFNLLVEDANGAIGKNTTSVTVQATSKPHANAGADQTVDEGEWVTLDGEDSYDPNGDELDYSWTQTSGQGVDLQESNDPQAHFWAPSTYDDETLKFSLRVQDSEGNSDESPVSVRVNTVVDSNDQPHADAGADQTVDEGQWVTLDGDGSYDPNGDELDYSWTQTSGQGVDLQNDDEAQAQFRAPSVNDDTSLKFELRVEDQNGRADEDSTTVNVNGITSNSDDLPCVQTYNTAHGTYVTDCNGNGGGNNGNTGNGSLPILPPCQPGSINPNCKPVTPPCEPGSINPNCKPVTPPCEPGSINPNCKPVTPPCEPGSINPNCKPVTPPCEPGSINPNCKPVTPPCEPGSINPNCKPVTPPCEPGSINPNCKPVTPPCEPGSINPNCKPVTPPCEPGSINPNCKPVTQPLKPNTQPKKIVTQPVKKPAKTQYEPPKNVPTKEHKSQKPTSNPPKPPTQKFKSSGGSGGSKLRR